MRKNRYIKSCETVPLSNSILKLVYIAGALCADDLKYFSSAENIFTMVSNDHIFQS